MRKNKGVRKGKIFGCFMGGAVGDALGAPLEFLDRESIIELYETANVDVYVEYKSGLGKITDDTQMLLFTAEGLLLAQDDPVESVYNAYLRWYETQQIGAAPESLPEVLRVGTLAFRPELYSWRAPGVTCLASLNGSYAGRRMRPLNDSKGCGTVMRIAPIGLFYEPEKAFVMGSDISALTHGHPTGFIAGGAMAMLVSLLFRGETIESSLPVVLTHLESIQDSDDVSAKLMQAWRLSALSINTQKAIEQIGAGWIAEEALAIAVFCGLRFADDFKSGVCAAVNISGDSDSTGAVTGNLLGVMLGYECIPTEWIANLSERAVVEEAAGAVWDKVGS